MRLLVRLFSALVAFAVAVWAVGSSTPADHVASSEADYAAPPEAIWKLLTDRAAYPTWRPDVKSVEIKHGIDERNPVWVETWDFGPLVFEETKSEEPTLLEVRILHSEQGFTGSWRYNLAPRDGGTTLRITESGHVDNPLFRLMARAMGLHQSMDAQLVALGKALGEPEVTRRHVTDATAGQ